ncbi:MAG: UDP-N-acetylmuramoyl-L-alanyl-D-glutamate--2,6-diaminopimelate ligase [Elusimicrobiales bacterium]|nr:UDP-N-acetylmuramoyl-L-alanyl-D-glutamate--2,6-diaminopimelate ligase [Elusimicrobiales bacterium]
MAALLSSLLKETKIRTYRDCLIEQISNDSRNIKPGALFFALKGSRANGLDFIRQAISKGAVAVIYEDFLPENIIKEHGDKTVLLHADDIYDVLSAVSAEFYGHPSEKFKLIGITGTKGKTTSSYFLETILASAGEHPGLIGTLSYKADGKIIGNAVNTTPFAHSLQQLFYRMAEAGCHSAAMEVSSHALALKRVEDVSFDIAVFTNLQSDHLDFHKDRKSYFLAKAHIFKLLALKGKGVKTAIFNADDSMAAQLKEIISRLGLKMLTYGIKNECDFRAETISLEEKFSSFSLHAKGRMVPVKISLPGLYNVYNALAAISAAVSSGIELESAALWAGRLLNVPGRLQRVEKGQNFSVFVDYAHTAGALTNVLDNLIRIPHNRIITVFGCGGDRDRTKRGPMGIAACSKSDFAYITDDNPRFENREQIFADIENGVKEKYSNYEIIKNRSEAIRKAVLQAKKGDIILIAGKGHETYQLLQGKTLHFSDVEEAEKALAEAGWK